MLPIQSLLDALGKPADDPAVKSLMQDFGVKRAPELDEDDEEAVTDWLPVRNSGIEFGFMMMGALKGNIGRSKYSGPLILHRSSFTAASRESSRTRVSCRMASSGRTAVERWSVSSPDMSLPEGPMSGMYGNCLSTG